GGSAVNWSGRAGGWRGNVPRSSMNSRGWRRRARHNRPGTAYDLPEHPAEEDCHGWTWHDRDSDHSRRGPVAVRIVEAADAGAVAGQVGADPEGRDQGPARRR